MCQTIKTKFRFRAQPMPMSTARRTIKKPSSATSSLASRKYNASTSGDQSAASSSRSEHSSVRVVVRCRQFLPREYDELAAASLPVEPAFEIFQAENAIRMYDTTQNSAIPFDRVYGPDSTNDVIYKESFSNMMLSACEGFNVCVFAYGQTSSGKTFTMQGSDSSEENGIIKLAMNDIFEHIKRTTNAQRTYLIRVSYLEIYNEQLIDLLSNDQHLVNIFVDEKGQTSFDRLTEEIVGNVDEVMDLIYRGETLKRLAKTYMNERSSRSHTLFRMIIERKDELSAPGSSAKEPSSAAMKTKKSSDGKGNNCLVRIAQLNLVDLAGSENVNRHRSSDTQRILEGKNINLSLLHLKDVITKLANKEKVASFRQSKLTRILGTSLTGNARVSVVCCVSPSALHVEQSKRTFEFGSIARKIQVKPTVEYSTDNALILKYQKEIDSLNQELQKLREDLARRQSNNAAAAAPTEQTSKQEELQEMERALQELQKNIITKQSLESQLVDIMEKQRKKEERMASLEKEKKLLAEQLELEEQTRRLREEEALQKQEEVIKLQKETETLRVALSRVKSEQSRAGSAVRMLNQQKSALEEQKEDLERSLQDVSILLPTLQAMLEEEGREKQAILARSRKQAEEASKTIAVFMEQCQQLEETVRQLKLREAELLSAFESCKSQDREIIDMLKQENATLKLGLLEYRDGLVEERPQGTTPPRRHEGEGDRSSHLHSSPNVAARYLSFDEQPRQRDQYVQRNLLHSEEPTLHSSVSQVRSQPSQIVLPQASPQRPTRSSTHIPLPVGIRVELPAQSSPAQAVVSRQRRTSSISSTGSAGSSSGSSVDNAVQDSKQHRSSLSADELSSGSTSSSASKRKSILGTIAQGLKTLNKGGPPG